MKKYLTFGVSSIMALAVFSACSTAAAQPSPIATPPVPEVALVEDSVEDSIEDDVNQGQFDFPQVVFPNFIGISGTVTEIHPFYQYEDGEAIPVEGNFSVWLETEDGTVVFNVDHHTFLMMDDKPEVGKEVIGYFDGWLPVALIYPPHYHARVLAPEFSEEFPYSLHVSLVDSVLVGNADNYMPIGEVAISLDSEGGRPLLLVIEDEMEIILQDGTPFEGEIAYLENRSVVVVTNIEDNTHKIVVLFERAVHPIHHLTDEELAMIEGGIEGGDGFATNDSLVDNWSGGLLLTQEDLDMLWSNMLDPDAQIIVDGTTLDSPPAPFVNREVGAVMLPVAYIAEALGYNVVGEGAEVVIGPGIIFTVGVDSYAFARMAPVQLGAAPELHDNVLFVPMQFFYNVLPGVAYIQDGHIIIYSEAPDWGEIEFID